MKRFLFIIAILLTVAGCAKTKPQPNQQYIDLSKLASLENITAYDVSNNDGPALGDLRAEAVKEAATSLGAQAGLAWQAQKFNAALQKNTAELDKTFNFRELLIDNKVQPPVLEQSDDLVNLSDPNSLRIADKTYKIVTQAQFVTAPLNWRNYLFMNYSEPSLPDRSLLPKNVAEQQVWANNVQRGWEQGVEQAKEIYLDNIGRLKRDYNGMLLYRTLLDQNMVSKPYVAETDLGVTSTDNNNQMYINDKVLRITVLPQLNPDSKKWHPVVTP